METSTASIHDSKRLSLRELESYNSLIMDLSSRQGTKFKDLQGELQKHGIYASEKTIRTARERLTLRRYITGEHRNRMIGIYQRWKKRGRNIEIKYKGKISTVQIKRAIGYERKKNGPDSHALTGLENYSGATPKEIFYYDPSDPSANLLDLDGCPWEAADRGEAIGYLSEHTQGQSSRMNPRSQMLAAPASPLLAVSLVDLPAHQNQLVSETATTADSASHTVWEWVSMASDTTDMPSSGYKDSLRQRALELYARHSGNSSYDPYFMARLSDQLLDNDQLDEADEVANFGVVLADSLYKSTDVQSLLARSKLAHVRNGEGKYFEAYQIGQAAVDGLKIKCGDYDEDVLQAECHLSDTLLMLGELKRAEMVCRNVLGRSFPGLVTDGAVLSFKFQLAKICNELGEFHEAKELLECVATERENELGFSAESTLRVHTELVRALQGLGDWDAVTRCGQIEREVSRRESNGIPRNMWTLQLAHFVAHQLYELGVYVEAEKCFRSNFDYIRRKVRFSSHPKVVSAECWIANSLHYQNKTKEAAAIYEKSVAILRDTLGPHHRATLVCMSNLAFALEEQLVFADFEARMLEVRDLRIRYLGNDDPDTLSSEIECAKLKATRGEWDDSLAAFEKQREMQKKIYKTTARPEIMDFLLEHSWVLGQRRDDAKAEEMQRQALDLGKRLFGADHPRALEALVPLVFSLSRMSRYPEAEALLSEGISTLSGNLGKQHPKVIQLELVRADILVSQERYAEAAIHQSRVLKQYSASYGEQHPYVIDVETKLARSYAEQNRIAEAQRLFEGAIESCRSTFGPDHRRVGYLELSFAVLFRKQRHLTEALCLGQKAWEQVNTSLGYIEAKNSNSISYLEHPEAIMALENLAIIRTSLGDNAESIALFDKILSLRTKFQGPTHPDTISALANLAWAYIESNEYYTAEQLYHQVVDKNSAVFGDWHSQTISARLSLGKCLCGLKKFSECRAMYVKMLHWLFDRHGEGHDDVARIYRDIAYLHSNEGNFAESERYLKYALRIFKKVGSKRAVDVMIDLCDCYNAMEEHLRAEVQAEEAIRHLDTTLGRDHPLFMQARIGLATALLRNNKYVQTDILVERLRQDIEKHEGQHSAHLLQVERLHAQSMHAQGRIQDADAFLQSCINRRQSKDVRNPGLCRLMLLLSDIKEEQGRLQEKEAILQNLLDSLERSSFDQQTTTMIEILKKLGRTRISLKKHESAEISMKRALDIQKKLWGEENEQTFETERTLAECLVNDDRLQERILLQAQILLKYQISSNLDPEDIIGLKREIAETYALARDFESEVLVRQTVVDTRSSASDPDRQYIWDLQLLALAYENLGHHKEAETCLECLDSMIKDQFPENIEDLIWNLCQLAVTKKKLGKIIEAESLVEQAVLLRRQTPKEKIHEFLQTLLLLAYFKIRACKWTEAKAAVTEYLSLREQLPEYDRPPIDDQQNELELINRMLSGKESATDGQLPSNKASDLDF